MSKYVNIEELKKVVNEEFCLDFTKIILNNTINELSSADIVEIKHGKWVDGNRQTWNGTYWFIYCSECLHERKDDNHDNDTPFCPNCGANMKGEIQNDM